MSVATKNSFALLGIDGEDSSPAAPAKAPAAQQPARNVPGAGNNRNANRGGPPRSNAPRNNRTAPAADAAEGETQQKDSRAARPRGDRPRGRGRGGREGGRGRAFDRHSQTDRVDSQKTVHQGWGGDDGKRELDVENKAEADAKAEGTETNGDAPVEEAEAKPEQPVEEEDQTITLDQYLASQAEKKLNVAALKPRETAADHSAWSNFGTKHEKNTGDDYFAALKSSKTRVRSQKEGKQVLEIEQQFSQPAVSRGRGGSGGRGRGAPRSGDRPAGRGRGGRGGNRSAVSVNLADQSAFPSLA